MKVEVAGVKVSLRDAETEGQIGRIVLGREDQSDRMDRWRGGTLNLRQGEVVDADDGDRPAHVAQLGPGELVGGGPCGEDGFAGIAGEGLVDGVLVETMTSA